MFDIFEMPSIPVPLLVTKFNLQMRTSGTVVFLGQESAEKVRPCLLYGNSKNASVSFDFEKKEVCGEPFSSLYFKRNYRSLCEVLQC